MPTLKHATIQESYDTFLGHLATITSSYNLMTNPDSSEPGTSQLSNRPVKSADQ